MLLIVNGGVSGRTWRVPLETFAINCGLEVAASYFPPGAWRWKRSVRQALCSCALQGIREEVVEIAGLDLVLPDVAPFPSSRPEGAAD
jgi:hypothetical protein